MDPLEVLRARLAQLNQSSQQILNAADADGREITDDERNQISTNDVEFDRLTAEIEMRERVSAQQTHLNGSAGRRADPQAPATTQPPATRQAAPAGNGGGGRVFPAARQAPGRQGFQSLGEFLVAVRHSTVNPQNGDRRLSAPMQDSTTTFANETAGADGGYMVPPDFRATLVERLQGEDSLLARTDQIVTATNNVTLPVDETEPWNDAQGIFARWENEGGAKVESKIELTQKTLRLNKLTALVPVSDELLEDAPAVEGYIRRKAPDKINFKVSRAIIAGTGLGQPLGLLSSAGAVVVDAGSAPADSIQFAHIAAMYGRMYGPWRSRAVWLVNPEVEAALMTMFFSVAPVASTPATPIPVYLPANSVSGSPYATLLGRPVIPTQACEQLGNKGDIIFADLSQYLSLIKAGGVKTDVSIHVYFVQDLTAFRFVLRVGGMPWWGKQIQPRSGTFTQGAFVVLEDR